MIINQYQVEKQFLQPEISSKSATLEHDVLSTGTDRIRYVAGSGTVDLLRDSTFWETFSFCCKVICEGICIGGIASYISRMIRDQYIHLLLLD